MSTHRRSSAHPDEGTLPPDQLPPPEPAEFRAFAPGLPRTQSRFRVACTGKDAVSGLVTFVPTSADNAESAKFFRPSPATPAGSISLGNVADVGVYSVGGTYFIDITPAG